MTHTTHHRRYTITTTRHSVRDWSITISDAPWAKTSFMHLDTLGECYRRVIRLGVDQFDLMKHTASMDRATRQGTIQL